MAMDDQYSGALLNNRYHTTTVTLAAFGSNGDRQSYNIVNRYFTILNATFATEADLQLSINDDPFTVAFKSIQFDFRDYPVEKITILNTNAAPNTVTLAFSSIPVIDNRSTVTGSVIISGGVGITSPAAFATPAQQAITTATATKVITGSATFKQVFLANLEAIGGTTLFYGDLNVGAARGLPLAPQQTVILDLGGATPTGDVWVYHAKGSNLSVATGTLS